MVGAVCGGVGVELEVLGGVAVDVGEGAVVGLLDAARTNAAEVEQYVGGHIDAQELYGLHFHVGLVGGVLEGDEAGELLRAEEVLHRGRGRVDVGAEALEVGEADVGRGGFGQAVAFGVEREPDERGAVELRVAAGGPGVGALEVVEDAGERAVGLSEELCAEGLAGARFWLETTAKPFSVAMRSSVGTAS